MRDLPKNNPDGEVIVLAPDDLVSIYADVFLITTEKETELVTLSFYQSRVSFEGGTLGTQAVLARKDAKCVGKIMLTQQGLEKLFTAMQQNREAARIAKKDSSKGKK